MLHQRVKIVVNGLPGGRGNLLEDGTEYCIRIGMGMAIQCLQHRQTNRCHTQAMILEHILEGRDHETDGNRA